VDKHIQEAVELGNTATELVIAGMGDPGRPCSLGILHALIAIALILRGN
jgi:hypothetical protein